MATHAKGYRCLVVFSLVSFLTYGGHLGSRATEKSHVAR